LRPIFVIGGPPLRVRHVASVIGATSSSAASPTSSKYSSRIGSEGAVATAFSGALLGRVPSHSNESTPPVEWDHP
jgi:hypothetical protein